MRKKSLPLSLLALILFIAVLNGLANEFSWYWRIPWFDMPMHFLGGLWLGSVALWWYTHNAVLTPLRIFLISLTTVLVVGVLWEFFEFSVDTVVIISGQNGILDTTTDIIFDIIGGITAAMYYIFKKQKNE